MGDGKLALILDVMGLAQNAHIASGNHEKSILKSSTTQDSKNYQQNLLIFGLGADDRMAVPLSEVARLEVFKFSDLEQSGDQDVIQYRGEIMPLIYLKKILNKQLLENDSKKELMPAVVFTKNGRSIGLVVERIIDIVEVEGKIQRGASRPGLLGTIVIQSRVTDLLDFESVVRSVDPSFLTETKIVTSAEKV